MATRCYGCMQEKEKRPVCEHCGYDERTQAQSHQLPPGTVVGRQYTLGRVLGQGGFGITYMGWDNVMNQRVAVKEYFPSGYAGRDTRTTLEVTNFDSQNAHSFEENKRRFLREAESLAKLWNVPQIVRVLRHFEENGTAYIAMEYVEGDDLRRIMKRRGKPMTMEEILDILGPILEALEQVHKAELVHRDISPDNIMVLPDGTGKLLDFGAARFVENANAEADRNTSTQAILKHGFAPPEQYRSRGALGPWSDVYAMCATVYYCLTGKIPPESMSRMMGEAELELDGLTGLSQQQKDALKNGMALMPRDRIKTAGELHRLLFGEILEAREAKKREPEKKAGKKKLPVLAAALALAAVLGAGVFAMNRQPGAPEVPTVQAATETTADAEAAEMEASVPETTAVPNAETEPLPAWMYNYLDRPVMDEDAGIFDWWEQNQGRYSGMANTFSLETGGRQVSMPSAAHEEYLKSVPIFDTDIPRSKITTVTFLDTLADAPEDAWNVSMGYTRGGSVAPENTVLAWVTPDGNGMYHLYIGAEGGINGAAAASGMFRSFINLREVRFNGCFHTEYADSFSSMFYGCEKLTSVDISTLDTSRVTGMGFLFYNCSSLTQLELGGLDTGSVTSMTYMFAGCTGLTELDLSSFDTSQVTDMGGMFSGCANLKSLNVSSFDTSNVTDMSYMFYNCAALSAVDMSGFDVSNVVEYDSAFDGCKSLAYGVSPFEKS